MLKSLCRINEHILGPSEFTSDLGQFNSDVFAEALGNLICPDVYFLKHHSYIAQAEWRFVWLVDHQVPPNLLLTVPDARRYCVPWEDQGDVIAFGGDRS